MAFRLLSSSEHMHYYRFNFMPYNYSLFVYRHLFSGSVFQYVTNLIFYIMSSEDYKSESDQDSKDGGAIENVTTPIDEPNCNPHVTRHDTVHSRRDMSRTDHLEDGPTEKTNVLTGEERSLEPEDAKTTDIFELPTVEIDPSVHLHNGISPYFSYPTDLTRHFYPMSVTQRLLHHAHFGAKFGAAGRSMDQVVGSSGMAGESAIASVRIPGLPLTIQQHTLLSQVCKLFC